MQVFDLRGKALDDPLRKIAYPDSPLSYPAPMLYSHLQSTRWYFDASDPANAVEADRVISDLCFAAETHETYQRAYRPLHVVVDNFGGTVVGILKDRR
jgi:hypothetical protein